MYIPNAPDAPAGREDPLLAAPSNRLWPRYPANFWLHLAQRNFVVAGINRWSTLPTTRCPPVPSMIPDCAANTISLSSPQAHPVIAGIIRSIKRHRGNDPTEKEASFFSRYNTIRGTYISEKIGKTEYRERSLNFTARVVSILANVTPVEIHRAQIAFLSRRRPARSITFYFCVAEQSSGLVR